MSASGEFRNTYRELAELAPWTSQRHEPALEPDLPIIDAQHHLWNDERGIYMVPDLSNDIRTGHNVIATVFVETELMYLTGGAAAMQPIGEVEFVNSLATIVENSLGGKCRICAGIVGHADLMLGDKVQPVLEALIAAGNGRFRGIRHHVRWDAHIASTHDVPRYLMSDSTFRRGFAHLAPLGLSFDVSQFYTQLPELADLLHAFPNTTIIANHCGGLLGIKPHDARQKVFEIWREYIRKLAPFPNLRMKLGGLGMMRSGWDFHLRPIPPTSEELAAAYRPYIETCIEVLGPERCMMESNFPPDKQTSGYGVLWNALKCITQGCSPPEKAALYSETAAQAYRL